MCVSSIRTHASMQVEHLQNGDEVNLTGAAESVKSPRKKERTRLPWIFDRYRSR
jgi:hypothetical protein